MPSHDQPLGFPVKGLHVSREFGQQPTDTTADCMNVASYDSIAGRNRGGSRAGFTKYVEGQSLTGTVSIQMLKVIVDPSDDALIQASTTPDETWVEHPRIPDLFIPPHGAPWQPNPNAPKPPKPSTNQLITVNLTAYLGGEDVTLMTVSNLSVPDPRTGSSSYVFDWDGAGTGANATIECEALVGTQYALSGSVDDPPQSASGSAGNSMDFIIPWEAGGTVTVDFEIAFD